MANHILQISRHQNLPIIKQIMEDIARWAIFIFETLQMNTIQNQFN